MKDQIEQFVPRVPSVVAVGSRRVRAWVGDMHAALNGTLWVGDVATRIVTLAPNHRVEALMYATAGVAQGDEIRVDAKPAGWPSPRPGRSTLDELAFEPGREAKPDSAASQSTAGSVGVEVIDTYLPVAVPGVTLVLDSGAPDACVDRLLGAGGPVVAATPREVGADYHIASGEGLALLTAAAWARELAPCTLLLECGPLNLDALCAELTAVTVLARVELRDGLEILGETLDLGSSDTQIFLRPDGSVDLLRSTSRLSTAEPLDLARLEGLREQRTLFGDDELEPEDLDLLERIDALERGLVA